MNIDERFEIMTENIMRQVREQALYALDDIKGKLEQSAVWRTGGAPRDGTQFLSKVNGRTKITCYDAVADCFVYAQVNKLADIKYGAPKIMNEKAMVWIALP